MGYTLKLHFLVFMILDFRGISSFEAGPLILSPPLPVLGDGDFALQCTFRLSSYAELLQDIKFGKKRAEDSHFFNIMTIPPPSASGAPINYDDPSLEARTIVKKPISGLLTSIFVSFNSTICSDIGEYKLSVAYYSGGTKTAERNVEVKVKVHGTFEGTSYGITGIYPGYDVKENTTVSVTCKADVGAEPQGQLEWYYFEYDASSTAYPISDLAIKSPLEPVRGCSHTQVSTLTLRVTENLNNILIRCTLQQDVYNPEGNDHRQSFIFNVTYSSRRTIVTLNPSHPTYGEGQQLTLTCSSAGNPQPSYTWLLPDGEVVAGASYQLQNLQLNDSGYYTCVAKNGVPDSNYRDTNTVYLTIVSGDDVTMTTESHSKKTSVTCSPCLTVTDQSGEGNKVAASALGAVAGVMGAIIIAQGIVLAFMIIQRKRCMQCRGEATYESPDRNLQGSEERSYEALDRPYDGYEIPNRQTTAT